MRILHPPDRRRRLVVRNEEGMAAEMAAFFMSHRARILAPLLREYTPGTGKRAHLAPSVAPCPAQCACHGHKSPVGGGLDLSTQQELDRLLMTLDLAAFVDLPAKVQAMIEAVATDGAALGAEQLAGLMDQETFNSLVKLVNERAVALAADRSAAMVGMKWVDGDLVPNPNAIWNISESTRELIRSDVSQALQEGWSNSRLADALMDREHAAFSEARANMVARTELGSMDLEANRAAWKESGLVEKRIWLLSSNPCEYCQANGEAGPIGLDESYPSGEFPVHPNDSCDEAPVVGD